jgi:uncharacterized membrane protein
MLSLEKAMAHAVRKTDSCRLFQSKNIDYHAHAVIKEKHMQGLKRKIIYAITFELIAVALTSSLLMLLGGHDAGHAGVAAIASSAIALLWNLVYNTLFEAWEARQATRGRSWMRRAAHAIGFEGGLVVTLVPLFAWWLDISLWQALVLDIGLVLFFMAYTFAFSLAFDRIFGLPASAQA